MTSTLVSIDEISQSIYLIRGRRVMLDEDLAMLYDVSTGALNQAVKRNIERFPGDFMFELTLGECDNLKSQTVISSSWGGRRKRPKAFTQEGVAMLSGILRSDRAIRVNIEIMRAFVQLREMALAHRELVERLNELENRVGNHDEHLRQIFEAIHQLMTPPEPSGRRIGF